MLKHPPTGTDLLGIDAATLLTYIYNPIAQRVVIKSPLPQELYSLRVKLPGVPMPKRRPLSKQQCFADCISRCS